jgi:hypothetical protein
MNNTFTFVITQQCNILIDELASSAQIEDAKFMQNFVTKVEILEQSRLDI